MNGAVNFTSIASRCSSGFPLCRAPSMPRCILWARVMVRSVGDEARLLGLVNGLTGVGIHRIVFSVQQTQVRGQISEVAAAVFDTSLVPNKKTCVFSEFPLTKAFICVFFSDLAAFFLID